MMMFMFVMMQGVDAHIYAEGEEEDGADHAEPLLDGMQAVGQVGYADGTVADQPRDEHDRQTRTQAEDDRHQPVPTVRECQRDINHRQEIDQTVRTKSDCKENTQYERPYPALLAVRLFEPFADAVVVLVVMVAADEQYDAADEHEAREYRLAPMTKHMLDALCLCAHEERDTQQDISR